MLALGHLNPYRALTGQLLATSLNPSEPTTLTGPDPYHRVKWGINRDSLAGDRHSRVEKVDDGWLVLKLQTFVKQSQLVSLSWGAGESFLSQSRKLFLERITYLAPALVGSTDNNGLLPPSKLVKISKLRYG